MWAGGVRAMGGEELGKKELQPFVFTLEKRRSKIVDVHSFKIADSGDDDNNIDLCIKEKGVPLSVSVKPNTAIDPGGDSNHYAGINKLSRW